MMIDRDIAEQYGVETKRLIEQIKRNIERLTKEFCFQLTKEECLRSQIATLNAKQGEHLKYLPYAFTEQGVAMLSAVLKTERAVKASVQTLYHMGASLKDLGKTILRV